LNSSGETPIKQFTLVVRKSLKHLIVLITSSYLLIACSSLQYGKIMHSPNIDEWKIAKEVNYDEVLSFTGQKNHYFVFKSSDLSHPHYIFIATYLEETVLINAETINKTLYSDTFEDIDESLFGKLKTLTAQIEYPTLIFFNNTDDFLLNCPSFSKPKIGLFGVDTDTDTVMEYSFKMHKGILSSVVESYNCDF